MVRSEADCKIRDPLADQLGPGLRQRNQGHSARCDDLVGHGNALAVRPQSKAGASVVDDMKPLREHAPARLPAR